MLYKFTVISKVSLADSLPDLLSQLSSVNDPLLDIVYKIVNKTEEAWKAVFIVNGSFVKECSDANISNS